MQECKKKMYHDAQNYHQGLVAFGTELFER